MTVRVPLGQFRDQVELGRRRPPVNLLEAHLGKQFLTEILCFCAVESVPVHEERRLKERGTCQCPPPGEGAVPREIPAEGVRQARQPLGGRRVPQHGLGVQVRRHVASLILLDEKEERFPHRLRQPDFVEHVRIAPRQIRHDAIGTRQFASHHLREWAF